MIAHRLPPSQPWCIGMTTLAGVTRPTPFSVAEYERARAAARRRVTDLGIQAGQPVLLISRQSEGGYLLPLEDALREQGATLLVADDVQTDARRAATLITRFHPAAVLGLGTTTLAGLREARIAEAELLTGTHVWARPAAYEELQGQGLSPLRWLTLGPALGLEGLAREGAAFDSEFEFTVSVAGELLISTTLPRLAPLRAEATGLVGVRVVPGDPDVKLII